MTPQRVRELALFIGAAVLIAIAGFSAGRFSAPREVEERVEYRTEWREKRVEVVKWKTARAVDTKTVTTPVLLPVPDGGVLLATATTTETRERETTGGRTDTSTDLSGVGAGSTSRKVTQQPDWRVGALLGVRLGGPMPAPVAGGIVERRIIGGVSGAVWGLVEVDPMKTPTAGIVGLGVTGEF